MLKKIKTFINCKLLRSHNWTCAVEEGIPATQKQLDSGLDGFLDYARVYCKDCGRTMDASQRMINANKVK